MKGGAAISIRRARTEVALLAAAAVFGGAIGVLAAPTAARAELPIHKSGAVVLDLEQIATAKGPRLDLDGQPIKLLGARVRTEGKVTQVGRTSAGESFVDLADGDARLRLKLSAPLDRPERLSGDATWEVLMRLNGRVRLADGSEAIAVGPDILIKTPGLAGEVAADDVIVQIAGTDLLDDPKLPPWESEEALYRMKVRSRGYDDGFLTPGATAMATTKDDQGRTVIDYRQNTQNPDGRMRSVRCSFRVEGGRLRNVGYGWVEIAADGSQTKHQWIDFEQEKYHDIFSARKKPFPSNTYAQACLPFALAGFPFGRAPLVRLWAWVGSGMPIPLYAAVETDETLKVRGRDEHAKKIRLGFDVRALAREIDLPEIHRRHAEAAGESRYGGDSLFWVATDAPHYVLRYQGAAGASGSTEVIYERIR